MPMQLDDCLLHNYMHNTNRQFPMSDYVGIDKFPEQNTNLLNSTVGIKYRNSYIVEEEDKEYDEHEEESVEEHNIFTTSCTVLRADAIEPYIMICVSNDYEFMFVTDSRYYETIVSRYPLQLTEIIGSSGKTQYPAKLDEFDCIVLSADNGEPLHSVIVEFREDSKRFLTGDEVMVKLNIESIQEKELFRIPIIRKAVVEGEIW